MMRLCTLLLLLYTAGAVAGPLDDGVAAFKAGNYRQALALWQPLAKAGDADAQYNIGLLYMKGLGVAKNSRTARQLFTAAAEQGQPDAQYNLGLMYFQGNTVFRSNKDAFTWWSRAAAQNHAPAQYNLGIMYAFGIWTEKDSKKALELWQASADQGNRDAIAALVRAYENGEFGVAADPEKARYWKGQLAQ
jgi:TPR repeat protein